MIVRGPGFRRDVCARVSELVRLVSCPAPVALLPASRRWREILVSVIPYLACVGCRLERERVPFLRVLVHGNNSAYLVISGAAPDYEIEDRVGTP